MANEFELEEFEAYVTTPFRAIQLVEANFPGVLRGYLREGLFALYLNGELVTNFHKEMEPGDELHFVPLVCGAIAVETLILIVVLIIVAIGLALALSQSKEDDISEDAVSFQTATNVVKEGAMLPIIYGTTRVGSVVLSSERGIDNIPTINQFSNGTYDLSGLFNPLSTATLGPTSTGDVLTTRVLHALSEGPIAGLVDGGQGIFFNDTQFLNGSNEQAFDRVRFEQALGADPNTLLDLITDSASEKSPAISTELTEARTVVTLDSNLDAARVLIKTLAFFRQRSDGDRDAISETVIIESRPTSGGAWTEELRLTINGSYSDTQFFQANIELDNTVQTDLAVSRLNPPSTGSKIFDDLIFENVVEIIRSKVRYDNTALVGLEYNNESFGGRNPETEFLVQGRVVKIPSNYNPTTRVYTGVWNGSYTTGYTNNPAFCVQDLLENNRYGLGEHLSGRFNAARLYSLGQFCDVDVDDGKGGTEPRYTINTRLTERKKAIIALRELTTAFRGRAVWDGTEVTFSADEPKTVTRIANQTNVVEGTFTYFGPSGDTQINSATVSYLDENNRYVKSQVNHRDHSRVARDGLVEKEYESLSTSPGQALRTARFHVLNSEGSLVSFDGIEDMAGVLPGELIAIFDPVYMGKEHSGRVSAGATTSAIPLDRDIEIEGGKTYQLRVVLADGTTEELSVSNAPGTYSTLNVTGSFTSAPQEESVWGVTASDLAPRFFVVESRDHQGGGVYRIHAIEHFSGRFTEVETGIAVDDYTPTTLPNPNSVLAPTNVRHALDYAAVPNGLELSIRLDWDEPDNAIGYDVDYQFNGGPVQSLVTSTRQPHAIFTGALVGVYNFIIRAVSDASFSEAVEYSVEILESDLAVTEPVSGLEIYEQGNEYTFENRDAKFTWRYSTTLGENDFGSEDFGADSLQRSPLIKDYVIRILDESGNEVRREEGILINEYTYTLEKNLEDGGPRRTFTFEIVQRDIFNNSSPTAAITVTNPQLSAPSSLSVVGGPGNVAVSYSPPQGTDWAGSLIYISDTSGFTPGPGNLALDMAGNSAIITVPENVTRYVVVASYDTFGQDSLNYSTEVEVTTFGADGRPGKPGMGTLLQYDDFETDAGALTQGQYLFSSSATTKVGISTWSQIIDGTVASIWIHKTDSNGADQSLYLDALLFGDLTVYDVSPGKWVEWQLTGIDLIGDEYRLQVTLVELDQTDSTTNPPTASGNDIVFGFSRVLSASAGAPGTGHVLTYDDFSTGGANAVGSWAALSDLGDDNSGVNSDSAIRSSVGLLLNKQATGNRNWLSYYERNVAVGDYVVLWVSARRWYAFNIDSIETFPSEKAKWGWSLVAYENVDGTTDLPTAGGNDVQFRFSQTFENPSFTNLLPVAEGGSYADMEGLTTANIAQSGTDTLEMDTTVFRLGTQSLKVTTTASGNDNIFLGDTPTDYNWSFSQRRYLIIAYVRGSKLDTNFRFNVKRNDAAFVLGSATKDLTAINTWERLGTELDLTAETLTSGLLMLRAESYDTDGDNFNVDQIQVFDVTDYSYFDDDNLPGQDRSSTPIAGIPGTPGSNGTNGTPAFVALGVDFPYDNADIVGGNTDGEYTFSTDGTASGGTLLWSDVINGNITHVFLASTDANAVDRSDYFTSVIVGAGLGWRRSANKWVAFKINGTATLDGTGMYRFPVEYVAHSDSDDTGDIDGTNPVAVEIVFSQGETASDGAPGRDAGGNWVLDPRIQDEDYWQRTDPLGYPGGLMTYQATGGPGGNSPAYQMAAPNGAGNIVLRAIDPNAAVNSSNLIPMLPGQVLHVRALVMADAAYNGTNDRIELVELDDNGASTSGFPDAIIASQISNLVDNTWTWLEGSVAVTQSDTVFGSLQLVMNNATAGNLYIAGLYVFDSEPGATIGATWSDNIAGQPADTAILNSLQEYAEVQNNPVYVQAGMNVNDWNVADSVANYPFNGASNIVGLHIRIDKAQNYLHVYLVAKSSAGAVSECTFELEVIGASIVASSAANITTETTETPDWQSGDIDWDTDNQNLYAPNGILIHTDDNSWDLGAGTVTDGLRVTLDDINENTQFRLKVTNFSIASASDIGTITFGDTVAVRAHLEDQIPIEFFFAADDSEDIDALLLTNGPAEAGATVGAQLGVDLTDEGDITLSDLEVKNIFLNGDQQAKDLTGNPSLNVVALDGRPWGVKASYGSSNTSNISYADVANTILRLYHSADETIGAVWPAFRVDQSQRYRAFIRFRYVANKDANTRLHFRFVSKYSAIAQGDTHIGWSTGESGVDLGDSAGSDTCRIIDAGSTGFTVDSYATNLDPAALVDNTWYNMILEYTPADEEPNAEWSSFCILNWDAASGATPSADLEVDTLSVLPASTFNTGALADLDEVAFGSTIVDVEGNVVGDDIVRNFDEATTLGLNPSFSDWTGTYPANWTNWANASGIVKETTLRLAGPYGVRLAPAGDPSVGIACTRNDIIAFPIDSVIIGSVDMYVVTNTSGGAPGVTIDLLAGTTSDNYRKIVAADPTIVGQWQRVYFKVSQNDYTAVNGTPGAQGTGIRAYLMGSWASMPGGSWVGDVIFDNIRLSILSPNVENEAQTWANIAGTTNAPDDNATQNEWRGPWATATSYSLNDMVSFAGRTYICILAHTSSTGVNEPSGTAADNTWWAVMTDTGTVSTISESDRANASGVADLDHDSDGNEIAITVSGGFHGVAGAQGPSSSTVSLRRGTTVLESLVVNLAWEDLGGGVWAFFGSPATVNITYLETPGAGIQNYNTTWSAGANAPLTAPYWLRTVEFP